MAPDRESSNPSAQLSFACSGRTASVTELATETASGTGMGRVPSGHSTCDGPVTWPLMQFISPTNWATKRLFGLAYTPRGGADCRISPLYLTQTLWPRLSA